MAKNETLNVYSLPIDAKLVMKRLSTVSQQ